MNLMFPAGYAITHNLTPFISMQNHYNLLYREEEREMLPLLKVSPCSLCPWTLESGCLMFNLNHQHLGVGCIPWSPLARGMVARPWDETTSRGTMDV